MWDFNSTCLNSRGLLELKPVAPILSIGMGIKIEIEDTVVPDQVLAMREVMKQE